MTATPQPQRQRTPTPTPDLLARYTTVFKAAWQHRAELAGPARLANELAFLPAALSLQDTPVHPAPRRLAYLLMGLFVIALAWGILGQVDIVANAPGRIIVSDRTKLIQPLEPSVVKAVLVKDGDKVQAGQILVALDATLTQADQASVQEQLNLQASEAIRTRALLDMLSKGFCDGSGSSLNAQRPKTPDTVEVLGSDHNLPAQHPQGRRLAEVICAATPIPRTPARLAIDKTTPLQNVEQTIEQIRGQIDLSGSERKLPRPLAAPLGAAQANCDPTPINQLQSEWADIRAKLTKLDAEATRRQAEIATVQASIAKLQATLPLAQTRETDFKALVGEGFISNHATQDKTRERIELQQDLATSKARLMEAQSALAESVQAKAAYKAETTRALNDRNAQATSKVAQLVQDQAKATQREKQTTLTAPVAGTVQQLAIHSVGGVVTSAQVLMVVVPDSPQVTAEVAIANQDIGFVAQGQTAEVKLETFPYTKYGTVAAKVNIVTADAVTDEKRGTSYYPATLTLNARQMNIDGKPVNLSPGMNITPEIKTGKRRIIEYLLSPVQRAGSESLRER